ncbi:hypothetical protein H4W33_005209 [Kibdelosporangium phytohabitans]|nr:hypothetical protein [Kibdelosporangium phytohabitans]
MAEQLLLDGFTASDNAIDPVGISPVTTPHARGVRGPRLRTKVITLRQAAQFIATHHRHHRPPAGHKFSIGVCDAETGRLVGVAVVGRPVARLYDDGDTLEVTRSCTGWHPQRELRALRRGLAGVPRDGRPPHDHLHARRRVRRQSPSCWPAPGRSPRSTRRMGPAQPEAHRRSPHAHRPHVVADRHTVRRPATGPARCPWSAGGPQSTALPRLLSPDRPTRHRPATDYLFGCLPRSRNSTTAPPFGHLNQVSRNPGHASQNCRSSPAH